MNDTDKLEVEKMFKEQHGEAAKFCTSVFVLKNSLPGFFMWLSVGVLTITSCIFGYALNISSRVSAQEVEVKNMKGIEESKDALVIENNGILKEIIKKLEKR